MFAKKATNLKTTTSNYTHQIDNPDTFLRFDLTEGVMWFKKDLEKWIQSIPLESIVHYPSGQKKNKELLASWLHVKAENIVFGNGSDDLIELIAQTYINERDEIVIPCPSFFKFTDATFRAGGVVHYVQFSEKNKFEWSEEVSNKFLKAISRKKVKIVWLASPNNPTGVIIPESVLMKIIKTGKMVILDKTPGTVDELHRVIKKVKTFPNLILLSSFSKTFGMPGLRCGFAVTNKNIVHVLEQKYSSFHISGPVEWLVKRLLEKLTSQTSIENVPKRFQKEKLRMEKELGKIPHINIASKSKANFLLIRHVNGLDLFHGLMKQNILVTNLDNTPGLINRKYIRVTIKSEMENNHLLKVLRHIR